MIKKESMVLGAVVGSMGIVEVIFEVYTFACPSNMPKWRGELNIIIIIIIMRRNSLPKYSNIFV